MNKFTRTPLPVLLFTLLFSLAFTTPAQAGLKIYYIRHAEYGGNVVKQWKDKPKSEWPVYVGRGDMFTPKGKEQVKALTEKLLKNYHFDFIAVSPAWRTRNTIAPYLKASHQTAEIWPELQEFNGLSHQHDPNLPTPSANIFTGPPVKLDKADDGLFTLRPGNPPTFKISKDPLQAAADRRAVVDKVIDLIHQRFDNQDKSILLVGHGNTGRLLAEELTHDSTGYDHEPHNTAMWMAQEQPDGSFQLRIVDDQPLEPAASQPAHATP